MARIALLVVVVLATLAGGTNLPASAQSTDMDQAGQFAAGFVATHATQWATWENASLGTGIPLSDPQGRLIAYAFPVMKGRQAVGKVVVGNSLYHWIILEAGDSPLPVLSPSEVKTILAIDLSVAAADADVAAVVRVVYLGYEKFVQIHNVGEQTVGVNLFTKHASLLSDVVDGLTPPEEMPAGPAENTTLWAGYERFALTVPVRNGADVPGLTNHCGPVAGAMVDEFYDGQRNYLAFEDWYADVVSLYSFMETNQHWPGGTLPPHALSGWLAYAESRGYPDFTGVLAGYPLYPVDDYEEYVAGYIVHFNPVLMMFLPWAPVYPNHWVAVWGFTPQDVDPSRMIIFVNNGWGGTDFVDFGANAGAAELVFVAPTGPIVNGKVVLQGGSRPYSYTEIPLQVRLFNPGATWSDWANNYVAETTVTTNNAPGVEIGFASPTLIDRQTFQPLAPGTYDVAIKAGHTLANIRRNVPISNCDPLSFLWPPKLNMGILREGNCNDDGIINALDFSILASSYLKSTGQQGYDSRADFDCTGQVNTLDFSLLATSYLRTSFQVVGTGAGLGGDGLLTLGTADLTLQPSTQTVSVNDTFNITVQVTAGDQEVNGVDAFMDFDPDYLEVVSITCGASLPVEMLSQYDNEVGTIDFSAGKVSGTPPSGTFTVATIQFRAIAETEGTSLTFSQTEGRNTEAAYEGESILDTATGATVTIES